MESTNYNDAEVILTRRQAGGEEDMRPSRRPICYFGFPEDEGSRREQGNSEGNFQSSNGEHQSSRVKR